MKLILNASTAKEYAHLPFERTFGPEYPYFLSSQDLARGSEDYVEKYDLRVWTSAHVKSATWNEKDRHWIIPLQRSGNDITLTARHMIFAIGAGGQSPKMPSFPDRGLFRGEVLHTVDYKAAKHWKDKEGVVIGAANSAHDVADDMVMAGLSSVTMVQRNPTWIFPIASYKAMTDPIYNDHIPTHISDRIFMGLPTFANDQIVQAQINTRLPDLQGYFDSIERRGFRVDRHGDLFEHIYERLGGHHLDVGTAAKIIDGSITVKSGALIRKYTPTGLEFDDGSTLNADVIVFATGFDGSMRRAVTDIVGSEIGEQLDEWRGFDAEGEIRGYCKRLAHPGVWYTGGSIGDSRFLSRFLAFQIKADLEGVPFEPYLETP